MKLAILSAVLLAGAVSGAPVDMAAAASVQTNVFLDNVVPNVDFLDRSSRMALDHSTDVKVKAYATAQAKDQTLAANSLDQWIDADRAAQQVVAKAEPAGLLTGRSVAIDGQPQQVADARLPMGQEDLDYIDGLSGRDFDQAYKEKQAIALRQVITDYQQYIAKGDDPILLGIASRELPKVQKRLTALHGV